MSHHATIACQFCATLNRIDLARYADGPKCAECGRPYRLDRPIKVQEEHFDKTVLQAEVPVLVDFYADWCGPCAMMQPLLDTVAHELAGQSLVVKVNTDAAPAVSQRYGIRSIPYFGRFERGTLTRTAVGAQSLEALRGLAAPDGSGEDVRSAG